MNKKLRLILNKMKKLFGDIPYNLFGSMVLGHVRENGFLRNDIDLDFVIIEENLDKLIDRFKKTFKNVEISSEGVNNNVVLRPIDNTNIIRVIKFKLNGVSVDIAIAFLIGDYRYTLTHDNDLGYNFHKFPRRIFESSKMVDFEGGIYPVPNTPLEYVECEYGKDWRVKKDKWNCCFDPPCIDKKNSKELMEKLLESKK